MRGCLFILLLLLCTFNDAAAQLSPPGLGETKTAFWSALGVKQQLDEKNTSVTYIGFGRISGMDSDDALNEPSILVLNQEFYHKLAAGWEYSYAMSYRRQHEYDGEPEVSNSHIIQQEFRVYGRLSFTKHLGNLKWKTTVREEARKFYSEDFGSVPDGLQFRTRVKTQLSVPLDSNAENSVLGSAEALFAIANDAETGWGNFGYKESRFCLYYSYAPHELPVTFDVGYMNDLIGYGSHTVDAGYLAMDIIIENPF